MAIQSRQNVYSDLDFRLRINPNTGDIVVKRDAEAIKQSVINILLTNRGERPFKPDFGGDLRSYLFENFDAVTRTAIQSRIVNTLRNYEPRVEVLSVDVEDLSYRNALKISMEVRIKSPEEIITTVEFTVERLR
jgi:phage baseplate assembly protein W